MYIRHYNQYNNDITREYYSERQRKKQYNNKKCYTCLLPKGPVRNHMIKKTEFASFHFDMWNRPFFIATPNYHYHRIFDMDAESQARLWKEIYEFIHEMGFSDFQCLFNNGEWQTHHHLHIKIKVDEKRIREMRKKHLYNKSILNSPIH